MDTIEGLNVAKDRLVHDFQAVVDGAEEMLRVTSNNTEAGYSAAKKKLEQSLKAARDEFDHIDRVARAKAKQAVRATDTYVRDNPWQAIAVGAVLGIAIGVLIARREL